MQIPDDFLLLSRLSIEAGKFIMEEFARPETVIHSKDDNSPLTAADLRSHAHIVKGLELTGIHVISEESYKASDSLQAPSLFWLIDPLDGTKEFIHRRQEFTVNIALVENLQPVLGCVYVPALGDIYLGKKGYGAFKFTLAPGFPVSDDSIRAAFEHGKVLATAWDSEHIRVVASKSHSDEATRKFIEWAVSGFSSHDSFQYGSSLKICAIAEGLADLYPRFGPTSRWDTAAAQAVLSAAGGEMISLLDGHDLDCRLEPILNPPFLAHAGDTLITRLGLENILAFGQESLT